MHKTLSSIATVPLLLGTVSAQAQPTCAEYIQDVTAFNPYTGDELGASVGVSGDTLVVGAAHHHITAPLAAAGEGAAFVYTRSGSSWVLTDQLTSNHPLIGHSFGTAVAIDGDTIAVSEPLATKPGEPTVPGAGCIFVFDRSGSAWVRSDPLFAPDAAFNDVLAIGALSGDTLVATAPTKTIPGVGGLAGEVYVFKRTDGAWAWQQSILSPEAHDGDQFGTAIAISGDTLVIGAAVGRYSGTGNAGAAYVYTRTGDTWAFQAKLIGAASTDIYFGHSVAVAGDTILVGAARDPLLGSRAGSVYVFNRADDAWTFAQKLYAADGAVGQRFGYSLALKGDTALIGSTGNGEGPKAPGRAFIFTGASGTWTQSTELLSPHSSIDDVFGVAVALDIPTAVVGDRLADPAGFSNVGAASIYQLISCCPADFTGDGLVDFSDYLAFLNLYDAGC